MEFIAQFRIRITYVCAHALLRRKKFGHWTKGYCLLTHETKNSPTWKLKYKKHLQLECPLPIHIKWRSLVWAKDTLNLLFLGKQSTWQQHDSHPGKPHQQQNHTKDNAGLNCLVGRFFCHKPIPNYLAERNLSMEANSVGRGRVTQHQKILAGEKSTENLERWSNLWEKLLSTMAMQMHHDLRGPVAQRTSGKQQAQSQKG